MDRDQQRALLMRFLAWVDNTDMPHTLVLLDAETSNSSSRKNSSMTAGKFFVGTESEQAR